MKKVLGILLLIISSIISIQALKAILFFILDFSQITGTRIYVAVYSITASTILLIALSIGIVGFIYGLKLVKKK